MLCKICEKETSVVCICGFCPDCIREKGHDKCTEILREKEHGKPDNK